MGKKVWDPFHTAFKAVMSNCDDSMASRCDLLNLASKETLVMQFLFEGLLTHELKGGWMKKLV